MSILYLRSALADISLGTNNTNKAGAAVAWRARALTDTVSTTANVTATVASVTGPTNGLETGAPTNEWISDPLAAAVTISGTITFNICANESNAMANAGVGVVVQRLSNTGAIVSTIVDSAQGTELSTANARRTWTATPTSTAMQKGDRFRIRVYFDDAGGTMGSGYTLTLTYDGTAANTGNSNVDFAETLTFMSPPSSLGPLTANANFSTGAIVNNTPFFAENTWFIPSNAGLFYDTQVNGAFANRVLTNVQVNKVATDGTTYVALVNLGGNPINAGIYTSSSMFGPWTQNTTVTIPVNRVGGLVYGNGVWVMALDSNAGSIYTATDPAGTWTLRYSALSTIDIAFGNNTFVALGTSASIITASDPTGTWTSRSNPFSPGNTLAINYGNNQWVATNAVSEVITATDPTSTWTKNTSLTFSNVYTPTYVGNIWILGSTSNLLYRATDPAGQWTSVSHTKATRYGAVESNNDVLISANISQPLTYATLSPVTTLYLTATTSDLDASGGVDELTAWTSRGNG